MKEKIYRSRMQPRLLVERSQAVPEKETGFLQMGSASEKIEIGSIESREFRLLQCLFSPKNFPSAKYEPVKQTYERVFGAIRMQSDALNLRLANRESAEREMESIVDKSLQSLRKGAAGEYLTVTSEEGRLLMSLG